MQRSYRSTQSYQAGFTLIEVLVAVLILSLGILGLVGMETMALKSNQTAYYRSQATVLAYDLADMMRANPKGVDDGDYIAAIPVGGADSSNCISYTSAATPSGCNSENIAKQDIYEWKTRLETLLPSATASIAVSGGIQTISVSWDDNQDGNANQSFAFSFEL